MKIYQRCDAMLDFNQHELSLEPGLAMLWIFIVHLLEQLDKETSKIYVFREREF